MKLLTLILLPLLSMAAAKPSNSNRSSNNEARRRVNVGDFDELNQLFDNASIFLPDKYEVSQRVGFSDLKATIWNIKCRDIEIGDMSVRHQLLNAQNMEVNIDVMKLDLDCDMNYRYTYSFLDGDGTLKLYTDDNSAKTKINFKSDDFNSKPPKGSSVSSCDADIEITRMDFDQDLLSEILEVFQSLVRGVIEKAIGNVACDELGSLGTTLVENMIDLAQEKLEPYQGELSQNDEDPLFLEKNLNVPDNDITLLNFKDDDNPIGNFFNQVFEAADSLLGTVVSDSTSSSTEDDLLINMLLRQFFLDDDGSYTLDPSQLPIDNVIFDGHDKITETTMTLNQVKIFGLDSMTTLESFSKIGSYTLQNELTWASVTIQFDVTVDIKPSTLDDAILKDPTSEGIRENITIDFGLDNINVVASLLLLINEKTMEDLNIGPMLYADYMLPCLLSAVHSLQLSGLTFTPQSINEPTLNGFISPGLDRVLTDSVEAAFAMYVGTLRKTLPYIFQISVRNFVNTELIDTYFADESKTSCHTIEPVTGYVDFRKFFDTQDKTYGDLVPLLKELMNAELLSIDPNTGRPKINEVLIKPYTKFQSGIEGNLEFSTDVFGFHSETISRIGMDSVEMRAFNPTIRNLDTMGAPIDLLKPNTDNGFLLENFVTLGSAPDSIQFALKGLFALNGDSALQMHNELELTVDITNSDLFAGFIALLDSERLFNFPIKDVPNVECWLDMFATPQLDSNGLPVQNGDVGLLLDSFTLLVDSMTLNAQCTNCTSPSLNILPELFQTLKENGVSDLLEKRLFDAGLEIVRSDFFQSYMNQLLADASLRCPHSPDYVDPSASSNYPVKAFPTLPYDSLESLAFTSTILLHMAAVVAAEAHVSYDLEETNPLDGQAELEDETGLRLIDFTSLDTTVGQWANDGVNQLIEYISAVVDDPKGPGGKDLRINSILRSTFLDESGVLDIEFNDLGLGNDDMQVSLKHVRLVGLDSISTLEVLDPIGAQTLQNVLKWSKLGIEITLSLMSSDTSTGRALKTLEDITLSLEFSDIDVSLALMVAIDLDRLGSIKLQSILDIGNILPCVFTAAHAAKVTEFQVLVGALKKFQVTGFRSEELNSAAEGYSRFMMDKYGQKIVASMPGFFDLTVRAVLNNMIGYYMGEGSTIVCPTPSFQETLSGFVDFRQLFSSTEEALALGASSLSSYGNLFMQAKEFVKDLVFKIDPSTGLSAANNALIVPLTKAQSNNSGTLLFPGNLFSGSSRVEVGGLNANIELQASEARIDNLDTLGSPLEILEAVMNKPYELNNTATFGVTDRPLRFGVRFMLSLMGDDDMQVRNDVKISLDLNSANVILMAMIKVAEARFYGFPLRDILDYNCWLAMIPAPTLDEYGLRVNGEEHTMALAELAASVASLNLNVTCVDCSSPKMPELTALLSKAEAQEDLTEAVNQVLDYFTELFGGTFLQVQLDRLLNEAAQKCPHSSTYDPDDKTVVYKAFEAPDNNYSMSFLITLAVLGILAMLATVGVIFTLRWIVRRRHKKWLETLPPHQVRLLAKDQYKEERKESELNTTTESMFTSPVIPKYVRWGMPLIILGNILFFLSGHLSLGATVNIEAELAGEKFRVDKFFEFSMARSTVDIWNAGGEELAIIILIFSGIWPYTKQMMTLALWFLPPSRLPVSKRESIFLWLDRLGKWSMIDIFVLVVSIAAFRVSIVSPETSYLPEEFYSLDLLVVPLWGLYANMIAQLISQVTSHFIIYYHRKIVDQASCQHSSSIQGQQTRVPARIALSDGTTGVSEVTLSDSKQKTTLHKHQFSRPHRGETEKLNVKPWVNKLLFFGTICLGVFVVIGCCVPSFSLEVLGIIGLAVESGQGFQDATTKHSVLTVIQLLFEEASFLGTAGDYMGLGTLSVLFIATVLVVPIVQSIALLRQWFKPSTRQERVKMSVFVEILQAWQYAEVYLIAVFVASWQLGPISEFMVNAYCESLKETFGQMVYYGLLKEEDAQCFSVRSTIEEGSFLLLFGAILLALLTTFVTKASVQYLRDQGEAEKRLRDEEDGSDYTTRSDEGSVDGGISARIHPVPVLFTDTFRWMLFQENNHWGLPDVHYHWGTPTPTSSRALFLPEARVLSEETIDGNTSQGLYAKNVPQNAKEDNTTSVPKGELSGFQAKGDTKPPATLSRMGSESSRESSISDRKLPPAESFKDESSVFSKDSSISQSITETVAAQSVGTTSDSLYESVDEEMPMEQDVYEELLSTDGASEYEEQTVDEEFEEYTVMSDIEEEEVEDDLSQGLHHLT